MIRAIMEILMIPPQWNILHKLFYEIEIVTFFLFCYLCANIPIYVYANLSIFSYYFICCFAYNFKLSSQYSKLLNYILFRFLNLVFYWSIFFNSSEMDFEEEKNSLKCKNYKLTCKMDFMPFIQLNYYHSGWHRGSRHYKEINTLLSKRLLSQKRIMTEGKLIKCSYWRYYLVLFCCYDNLIVGEGLQREMEKASSI